MTAKLPTTLSTLAQQYFAEVPATDGLSASAIKQNIVRRAALSQALADAKPADGIGAVRDNMPLAAGKTLVGSTANPNALTQSQLHDIAHKADAAPQLPPHAAHVKPINSMQSGAVLTRLAATRLGPNQTTSQTASSSTSTASSTATASTKSSATRAKRPAASARLTAGALASGATSPAMMALGAAAPVAWAATAQPSATDVSGDQTVSSTQNGGAVSTGPSNLAATTTNARKTVAQPGALGAGTTPEDATETTSQSSTTIPAHAKKSATASSASTHTLTAAEKRGDAAVGVNHGPSGAALDAHIQSLWDKVIKAGEHQDFKGPINWQAFFNLLAAKNSKLIGTFIQLQEEATALENAIAVDSLKLDKEITETGQLFAKSEAFQTLVRQVFGVRDWVTQGALRGLTKQNPLLSSMDLDLQSGLDDQQMQGPVQETFMHSQVHQLAGDKAYNPVLPDPKREARVQDFRTVEFDKVAQANPQLSQEEIHEKVAAHYATVNAAKSAEHKVMTSVTYKVDGQDVTLPLKRTFLSAGEIAGLDPVERAKYNKSMDEFENAHREDWTGRQGIFEREINVLESAAAKVRPFDSELADQLHARAKAFEPAYEFSKKNVRGAMDSIGNNERRFDEAMRNRGAMETQRQTAAKEAVKLQAFAQTEAEANTPEGRKARDLAMSRKATFQNLYDSLNRRCSIFDDELIRFIDSKVDNRRGRNQSGAESLAQGYRNNTADLAAAQRKVDDMTLSAEDREKARGTVLRCNEELATFNDLPGYLKNSVNLHEELIDKLITPAHADKPATYNHPAGPDDSIFKTFEASLSEAKLSDVSRTRMVAHVKERAEALAQKPDTDAEKMALKDIEAFWRKTDAWQKIGRGDGGYVAGASKASDLLVQKPLRAAWTNIKLRGERAKVQTPDPKTIPPQPTERHWRNADGTQGARVDFTNPEEASRYYAARAAAGGRVFGTSGAEGGQGIYKNKSGQIVDRMNNVMATIAQYTAHPDTMQDLATGSAQGISSDAQEALSQFMSLLAQARQQTNGLVEQMYKMANTKVGGR